MVIKLLKRTLFLAVFTLLLSMMFGMTVYATEYDLWVRGTRVTSENLSNVLGNGKVTFDDETNTLNFNDVTLSSYIQTDVTGTTANTMILSKDIIEPVITYKARIVAIDIATGEEIEGATIQILDEDEYIVEEWTSQVESHEVSGLSSGIEYTLRTTVAPDEYTIATDTTFTIDSKGKITSTGTITEDGTMLVELAKTHVDIMFMSDTIDATAQVLDSEGNVVDEWDSTSDEHSIEGLIAGEEYTINVIIGSNSYIACTFTIDEAGTVTSTATISDGVIQLYIEIDTPATITLIESTLTIPNAGDTITLTGESFNTQSPRPTVVLPENANYTLVDALWYTDSSAVENSIFKGEFEAGETYYAFLLYATSNEDYVFSDATTITVNTGNLETTLSFDEEYDERTISAVVAVTIPEAKEDFIWTVKDGAVIGSDEEDLVEFWADYCANEEVGPGLLIVIPNKEEQCYDFYNLKDKLLFTLFKNDDKSLLIKLAEDVTSADNIIYDITDEDRAIISRLAHYKTAQLLFDVKEIQDNKIEEINVKLEIPKAKTKVTMEGEDNNEYKYTQSPKPNVKLSKNVNYILGEYFGYEEVPVNATFWYADSEATQLFSGDMIAGETYYADLWFEPNEGYIISESVRIIVNSKQFNATTDGTDAYHVIVPVTIKASSTSSGGSSSSYKVTTKIENGIISPANASVKKNANQEFIFKINEGYEITDVLVDGKSVGAVNKYTLEKVTAKHTIEVKTQKESSILNVDDWAKEEMEKAKENGLIPETFNKKYASKAISRADFAAVAVKLYECLTGKSAEKASSNPFTDTNDDYVLKAYALGITKGVSDTEFGNGTITREQMATMVDRALNKSGINIIVDLENVTKFADDNEMHDWSRPSIYAMSKEGIIKGVGGNKYNPLGVVKVEESLAISLRCIEAYKK